LSIKEARERSNSI